MNQEELYYYKILQNYLAIKIYMNTIDYDVQIDDIINDVIDHDIQNDQLNNLINTIKIKIGQNV